MTKTIYRAALLLLLTALPLAIFGSNTGRTIGAIAVMIALLTAAAVIVKKRNA